MGGYSYHGIEGGGDFPALDKCPDHEVAGSHDTEGKGNCPAAEHEVGVEGDFPVEDHEGGCNTPDAEEEPGDEGSFPEVGVELEDEGSIPDTETGVSFFFLSMHPIKCNM